MTNTIRIAPCTLWFTGLSGAGKSTTALQLQQALVGLGYNCYLLDGDQLRQGLCRDLGFSRADRDENIRRIGEVAKLMVDAGLIVISATISPYRKTRDAVRAGFAPGQFIEVFVDAPLAVCEARDPKGLYRRARAGEISDFTGIDSAYEVPTHAELHLRTDQKTTTTCVKEILAYLQQHH